MLVLMAFAVAVCVLQLAILGSFARSLRLTTLLMAIGVGFYFCGTLAVLLQLGWTRTLAGITGWSLHDIVERGSYTVDPVIEEVIKVLPLVVLGWWWRSGRRQLGLTNHLLAGAALGAGFELFEAALRFSSLGVLSLHTRGGYIVSGGFFGAVTVPSIGHSLTTWQPAPAAYEDYLSTTADTVQHLVWTAIAALGLGLVVRLRTRWRWLGLAGLVVACLDHMNYNLVAASAVPAGMKPWSGALTWVGGRLQTVMVIALTVAVIADRYVLARWRAWHRDLLLPGEPTAVGCGALLNRALVAIPWSTYTNWRFVLARRGALYASAAGADQPELRGDVARRRSQLERATSLPAWNAAGERALTGLRQALSPKRLLGSPWLYLWLLGLLPALAYLVAGGFLATRGLQRWMRDDGRWLLVASAAIGVVLLLIQLRFSRAMLRRAPRSGLHEARVRPTVRILTALGGLVAVVPALYLALVHGTPDRRMVNNFHALDAVSSLYVIGGLALFAAALFFFPPFGLAIAADGLTTVLVPTLTAELAVMTAGSAALVQTGMMLNQAAGDSGSGDLGGSSSRGLGRSAGGAAGAAQ